MKVSGACHCGKIRFTAEVDETRVVVCHCTDCQVLSGSPFRVTVSAARASLQLLGEPSSYLKIADSGARRLQAFCGDCGTPLYSAAGDDSQQLFLRLGAIEQREALRPALQIWQRSAMAWLGQLDGVPGCQRQEGLAL